MDREIVDSHQQLYPTSCIPMAIELVLKLLGRISIDYYDLQKEVPDKTDLSFGNYNGRTINGIKFEMQFAEERNDDFPIDELFAEIERHLSNNEFIIISLENKFSWHMWVVYKKDKNGDLLALGKVGKEGKDTEFIKDVKNVVIKMKGTDILTYQSVD